MNQEFEVVQPGGRVLSLLRLSADQREETLLTLAAQDAPQSVPALIAYLSQPASVSASS